LVQNRNEVPFIEMFDWRELRWFGHLSRMDNNKKPRQVWERRDEGMQRKGRARIEWEEPM
jgi:hypothetical protein